MKKFLLLAILAAHGVNGWSQKQNITNAGISLRDKDYKQALKEINEAVSNPETKDEPKAWYVRGNVYMEMQNLEAFKAENPYRDAATSYMTAAKLKPGYEKENINRALIYAAQVYYNDAVGAYNNKSYDEAMALSKKVLEIKELEEGKRFSGNKGMDTMSARALTIAAYSAYYGNKYEEAIPLLTKLKTNPIEKGPDSYMLLSDIYSKQNKTKEQLAIVEEGRKMYPENPNIRNEELNYYIKTGQTDVLMKKLEAAVAADPKNPVLLFNLANGYMNAAFPKDASGKELPKPANYSELIGKAETAYLSTISIDAKNAEYNYNTGVLYYNQATEYNKQMNDITGNTAEDNKKYDQLKKMRDDMFGRAIPYFDIVVNQLEPKVDDLSPDDRFTYQSALVALKEIYAKQDKLDKSAEMKRKLEATK